MTRERLKLPKPIPINAARKERASRVAALEKDHLALIGRFSELIEFANGLEAEVANLRATVAEVVSATNSASVVLACVERHLDGVDPNWDGGARAEVEARAKLVRRRRELLVEAGRQTEETTTEERAAIAREIWAVARELDVREQDLAFVVSLHIKNRDVESALDLVEEVRRDDLAIEPKLAALLNKLVDRCAEIARENANDVAERRAENAGSGLVGPDGSPL